MNDEVGYLKALVKPLVGHPDDVVVAMINDDRGMLLTLTVEADDVGKVIGKKGETARAIRRIIRQYGAMRDKKISVKITDPLQRNHDGGADEN